MAQLSNLRCKSIPGNSRFFKLDSLPIEPSSVYLLDKDIHFDFDETDNTLTLPTTDSVELEVCYRVISSVFTTPMTGRPIAAYEYAGSSIIKRESQGQTLQRQQLFSSAGLNKSGTISRGVSFGNRQSLFVNSSLNLQMQGRLSDNLSIQAVITDQNIPYQPEGNTQQLRDFDNVFVKIYNDRFGLTAGDVVLKNPFTESYFLKYYKNVQGLSLTVKDSVGKWQSFSQVNASVAKGKFASIAVDPIEGVQGPYRLRGAEGERFIIVLANSEKVYLDGQLLNRGFDNDYVIDYNLGEVTFNANVVITQFSRIRIDFEYAEQNYGRSNLSFNQLLATDRTKFYFSIYREKDNPSNTLGFDLDTLELASLQLAGDDAQAAVIGGIDSVDFDENRILYARKQVTIENITYTVYEASQNRDSARFSLSFTELGLGLGNYVLVQSTANGRIYQWVPPINGQPQGVYEPVIRLTTPNQRLMTTFGLGQKLGKYDSIYQELAISNHDRNLFSSLDDSDNVGFAWKAGWRSKQRKLPIMKKYQAIIGADLELNGQDFRPIDRFRYIEFDRDWNYLSPYDSSAQEEIMISSNIKLEKDKYNRIDHQFYYRKRGIVLEGTRQKLKINQRWGKLYMRSDHLLMFNEQINTNAKWQQSFSEIGLLWNKWNPGYRFRLDENEVSNNDGETIGSAMHFREHSVFLKAGDSTSLQMQVDYRYRDDQIPIQGVMQDFTHSDQASFSLSTRKRARNKVIMTVNYRQVENRLDPQLPTERNVQGRLQATNQFFNRHLLSRLTYSTTSSRELRREFVFVPVTTGEGTHTWRDDNGDGVQDLNEFYEAINPDERLYIKLFVPTDEYQEAFNTLYTHTIDAYTPRRWRDSTGLKRMLSRVSFNINFNVNQKVTDSDLAKRLNPFFTDLSSEVLVATNARRRYSLFYNRSAPGLGMDLIYLENDGKQLLSNGFEIRQKRDWTSNLRLNIARIYVFNVKLLTGTLGNSSDFLESRNFDLNVREVNPGVTWQPSRSFRLNANYLRRERTNQLLEVSEEQSTVDQYQLNLTWTKVGKGALNAKMSWVDIDFTGEENSYLGYVLLDALRPGTNITANVNWQQALPNGLQLTLQYFGRKSENVDFVHTGSMQLTAFF